MSYGEIYRKELKYKIEKVVRPIRRCYFHATDSDGDMGRFVAWTLVAVCAFAAAIVLFEGRIQR